MGIGTDQVGRVYVRQVGQEEQVLRDCKRSSGQRMGTKTRRTTLNIVFTGEIFKLQALWPWRQNCRINSMDYVQCPALGSLAFAQASVSCLKEFVFLN